IGFGAYRIKSTQGHEFLKDFYAAAHVLDIANPTNAQADSVSQTDVDAVNNQQIAVAFRRRLIAVGRNAGLRAYDFRGYIEAALVNGDRAFALEVARVMAGDLVDIVDTADYYLTGLSETIFVLKEFVNEDPSFAAIIETARTKLLAQQRADGIFRYVQ